MSAVLRYVPPSDGSFQPKQLAQQLGDVPWELPINIMISDSLGMGALITLKAEEFAKH